MASVSKASSSHSALELVPVAEATHVAAASGSWSSAATWTGGVPSAGAKVYIPAGKTVTYDVPDSSVAQLQWLRIEGKLSFSRTQSSHLLVDTIIIAMTGEFDAGTVASPIPAGVNVRITTAVGSLSRLSGTVLTNDTTANANKVLDGNFSTILTSNSANKYYGYDLGAPVRLTAFRADFVTGPFGQGSSYDLPTIVEGASDASFTNPVELLRFHDWNPNGPTCLAISDPAQYRYVRVKIGQSYRKIADISFWTGTNTPIDVIADPEVLGRGLLSMGKFKVHGAGKTDWLPLAVAPGQGDSILVLNQEPVGWAIGDELVLTGTSRNASGSNSDNSYFKDEVLRITNIVPTGSSWQISFENLNILSGPNNVLRFDHDNMPAGSGLTPYLANLSRNVLFETEGWRLGGIPAQQRGHIMIMHNDQFDVRNAAFQGLGRTDKIFELTDPTETDPEHFNIGTENPRGRYAFHVHKANNQDLSLTPPVVEGCAVWNSPGWSFANHDSYVNFVDCVAFEAVGAHYMTELGNELGLFERCIAIKATGGANGDEDTRATIFDHGHHGQGFWIQGGGGIRLIDCVASGCQDNAFYIWGENGTRHPLVETYTPESFPTSYFSDAYGGDPFPDEVPLLQFKGNTAFNSKIGFSANYLMWQKNSETDTIRVPDYSLLEDSDFWGIWGVAEQATSGNKGGAGIFIYYSSNIYLKNCRIFGFTTSVSDPTTQQESASAGIHTNWAAMNLILENTTVSGWDVGVKVFSTQKMSDLYRKGVTVISGGSFQNRVNLNPPQTVAVSGTEERFSKAPPYGYLEIHDAPSFSVPSGQTNTLPTAAFTYAPAGGLAVRFDGRTSSDPDLTVANPKIAAWGWDFDNDGSIDQFGPDAVHTFPNAGNHDVTLTVWDNMGATHQTEIPVTVVQSDYPNIVVDGSFETAKPINGSFGDVFVENGPIELGWFSRTNTTKLNKDFTNHWLAFTDDEVLGQVVAGDRIHRGLQDFTLSLRNVEGDGAANSLTVSIYGINTTDVVNSKGLPTPTLWESKALAFTVYGSGPSQLGDYPFSSATLLASTQLIAGSTGSNWDIVTVPDIDFGDGYDYFSIVLKASGINAGDTLLIDDIGISKTVPAGNGPYIESGGQVVMEAESWDANSGLISSREWLVETPAKGSPVGGNVIVTPDTGNSGNGYRSSAAVATAPHLGYDIQFQTTGTYYVWIRTYATSGDNDSCHVGLNGTVSSTGGDFGFEGAYSQWNWSNDKMFSAQRPSVTVSSAGVHTLDIWMREDGARIDRIILTQDPNYTPGSGSGPVESPRQ